LKKTVAVIKLLTTRLMINLAMQLCKLAKIL
jgi:hypothetical protein